MGVLESMTSCLYSLSLYCILEKADAESQASIHQKQKQLAGDLCILGDTHLLMDLGHKRGQKSPNPREAFRTDTTGQLLAVL